MQEFLDFLWELFRAVAMASVPVCAAFAMRLFHTKSQQASAQTDNLLLKSILDEVDKAVTTGVTYSSQTFVDSLKNSGNFGEEAQKEAFQIALDKTLSMLSQTAKELLANVYGDVTDYLTGLIEAEVKNQKIVSSTTAPAEDRAEDAAVLAATTAGATAATVAKATVDQLATK